MGDQQLEVMVITSLESSKPDRLVSAVWSVRSAVPAVDSNYLELESQLTNCNDILDTQTHTRNSSTCRERASTFQVELLPYIHVYIYIYLYSCTLEGQSSSCHARNDPLRTERS